MKKLSKEAFDKASQFILNHARNLDRELFKHFFIEHNTKSILRELKKYQNEDGGFGHALEPDTRLAASSPICTDRGLRILENLDYDQEAMNMIRNAIHYYERNYNKNRQGWFVISKEVNEAPHAPWWHYDKDKGMTLIDRNWGNSSAEIIGYLYKYRKYLQKLNVDELVDKAINYVTKRKKFDSENEVYCCIRLHNCLEKAHKKRLLHSIEKAIDQVIEKDETNFKKYVPTPLDFVPSPLDNRFGISEADLSKNLDFIIDRIERDGKVYPPWDPKGTQFYKNEMKPGFKEWQGIITLEDLLRLKNYNRIEK